jgi:invasion protein IalB
MTLRPLFIAFLGLAMAAVLPRAEAQPAKKHAKPAPKHAEKSDSGPKLVAQYSDWGVYVANSKGKICYAVSEPKRRTPKLNRDPGYMFVTTRPAENVHNEVSVVVGFPIKEGSDATVDIGSASFAFYTKSDSAWIKNAAEEGKLIEAMRKGSDLTLKSTSTRGNASTAHYSLSGISQALDRLAQECK